jgi:Spy/CpxP family protein refolding chaperone
MKRIIGIISILFLSLSLQAQPGQQGQRGERVKAIKIGYITDKLQLTSTQATAFWPIYDEYEKEKREARQAFMSKYRDEKGKGLDLDDNAEASNYLNDNLAFQEKQLSINRKYKDRLLKVISAQQLATLYEAERDFKKLLVQQLRQRRGTRR